MAAPRKKIPVAFADLHKPLFLNGNHGEKLPPKGKGGMTLSFDDDRDRLIVTYRGSVALISSSNIASWTPVDAEDVGVEFPKEEKKVVASGAPVPQNDLLIQQSRAIAMGIKTAQVATPAQPVEGVSIAGKPKILSHDQLKVQLAADAKQVK